MNKISFIKYSFILSIIMLSILSCERGPGILSLVLVSIEGTGPSVSTGEHISVFINTRTPATDVPVDLSVQIIFEKDVDEATVTKSSVILNPEVEIMDLKVTKSSITFKVTLEKDTEYTLKLTDAIKAKDGGHFLEYTRSFTTGK